MNDLENILNKKNFEEKIIQSINSNIFNSLDDIDFIINKLRNKDNLRNKKIFLKLLFKATKDGQESSDFHKKCDGKVQQLVFIKQQKEKFLEDIQKKDLKVEKKKSKIIMLLFFHFQNKKYTLLKTMK